MTTHQQNSLLLPRHGSRHFKVTIQSSYMHTKTSNQLLQLLKPQIFLLDWPHLKISSWERTHVEMLAISGRAYGSDMHLKSKIYSQTLRAGLKRMTARCMSKHSKRKTPYATSSYSGALKRCVQKYYTRLPWLL